jgi:hypothetical protein
MRRLYDQEYSEPFDDGLDDKTVEENNYQSASRGCIYALIFTACCLIGLALGLWVRE